MWFGNNKGVQWGSTASITFDNTDSAIHISGNTILDGDLDVAGDVIATGQVTGSSDERLKENFAPVNVAIEDIAKARIVNFNFKGENKPNFGSIAQDWLNIFPNAILQDKNGYYAMNYSTIALGSTVTAAREIVELKK